MCGQQCQGGLKALRSVSFCMDNECPNLEPEKFKFILIHPHTITTDSKKCQQNMRCRQTDLCLQANSSYDSTTLSGGNVRSLEKQQQNGSYAIPSSKQGRVVKLIVIKVKVNVHLYSACRKTSNVLHVSVHCEEKHQQRV